MLDLNTAIQSRRSVREFSDEKIHFDQIQTLIDSAKLAPTSCNLQVYKFIYIDDESILKKMAAKVTGKVNWTKQLLVLLVDPKITFENHANYVSAGMVVQNLMLSAVGMGLATCPIAGFKNKNYLKKLLNIPQRYDVPLLVFIGHPISESEHSLPPPYRCTTSQIVCKDQFDFSDTFPTSSFMDKWDQCLIDEYRRRIMAVYYPRFGHSIWGDNLADPVNNILNKNLNKKILYILPWEKWIIEQITKLTSNLYLADSSDNYLGFLAKTYPEPVKGTCNINKPETMSTWDCDIALICNTLIFQKNIDQLLRIAKTGISENGTIYVSYFQSTGVLGIVFNALRMLGLKRDVYHKSPFYKFGPFSFKSRIQIESACSKLGLAIVESNNFNTTWLQSRIKNKLANRLLKFLAKVLPETKLLTIKPEN